MKKVFTKVSGFVLIVSLLCSTVPAMALFGKKTAPAVVKATPGFMSKAIAAMPTWKCTKAVFGKIASVISAKNATELVKNHRTIALIGAGVLTAGVIYGGYKLIKKAQLPTKFSNAKHAVLRKLFFVPC